MIAKSAEYVNLRPKTKTTIDQMAGKSIFEGGAARLVSRDCALCGTRSFNSLCQPCTADLPQRRITGCRLCAAVSSSGEICGHCLVDPPKFDETVVAFDYVFPLDRLLQAYKFREHLALVNLFADALETAVRRRGGELPTRVVPLPLSRARLAERGFNQSALLAERVANSLKLKYAPHGLLKVRDTPPQSGLNREARQKNVRGAFDCGGSLAGEHIALVDDVMTTGATLAEAAKAIKKAGATRVSAWVVARGPSMVATP